MKRHWNKTAAGGAILAVLSVLVASAPTRHAATPREVAHRKPSPRWLGETPLVLVENHDSIPLFRRRVGGNPTWQEEDYVKEQSKEAIRRLRDLGVTLAIIPFFKGFGLEAEREYLADSQKLAALLHGYGIKVGVYVGSTIAYETFLLEKPQAADWFVPDFMGRPVFYDDQTFRRRVYFMHPDYRDYIKRVLRLAEDQLHADLIEF